MGKGVTYSYKNDILDVYGVDIDTMEGRIFLYERIKSDPCFGVKLICLLQDRLDMYCDHMNEMNKITEEGFRTITAYVANTCKDSNKE